MGVSTQRYVRKPLYVQAVRVTNANFEEVAAWCDGEIGKEVRGSGAPKKCIRVRVQYPKSPRQTWAFVGDWILYTERGYKVYTNRAFNLAFDLDENQSTADTGQTGDGVVTPPTAIEKAEIRETSVVAEDPDPTGTGVQPIESVNAEVADSRAPLHVEGNKIEQALEQERRGVESAVDDHTTPQGEPHQYEEATPEGIAEAMRENTAERERVAAEAAKAAETGEGIKVQDSPTSPPVEPPTPDETRPEPVSDQPPEIASAGKQVLSVAEQERLGPDEVRALVSSGDVILAQDLAS